MVKRETLIFLNGFLMFWCIVTCIGCAVTGNLAVAAADFVVLLLLISNLEKLR